MTNFCGKISLVNLSEGARVADRLGIGLETQLSKDTVY